nr:hypothetical protein [uncultured Desulfuromonas sp.]
MLRNYLGLEVAGDELRAISIKRRGRNVVVNGVNSATLGKECLKPVFLEPQIQDPDRFVKTVQEVFAPLSKRERRIAVALPDQAGRQFLIECDGNFKNYHEGLEIVRWHLKSLLATSLDALVVDYQPVSDSKKGKQRMLVSLMASEVLFQYENVFHNAGFNPALIDFQCMNLYSAFRNRLDRDKDFLLIGYDQQQLCFLAFVDRTLDFLRTKQVDWDSDSVYKELNRTLGHYRKYRSAIEQSNVYLYCPNILADHLIKVLSVFFEHPVELLSSFSESCRKTSECWDVDHQGQKFSAAFGAAERMIKRFV